jgi:hypothetical protein
MGQSIKTGKNITPNEAGASDSSKLYCMEREPSVRDSDPFAIRFLG